MAGQLRKVETLILEIAGRQQGAVTRRQLLAAGISRHEIELRIAAGFLLPIHRGVYVVAPLGAWQLALESAATLGCGPGALLGRRTSARLWDLPAPAGEAIEVITPARDRRALRGVRTLSITALHPTERRRRQGLPVTSPSLTLLDLAGVLSNGELAAALNEARVQRLVREDELKATLGHHPQRRGAGALRRLLDAETGPRITRSEAERRAQALMRRHGLEPETDVEIGPWRVDFLFRAEGVVVEVDGYRYHSTPQRFVDDRRRAADLTARGLVVLSLTWKDLGPEGNAAMTRLQRTLDQRRSP